MVGAICAWFLLASMTSLATAIDDVMVDTPSGAVRGTRKNVEFMPSSVDQFLGIPFAKPPVGDLRFQRPVPIPKWSGVIDATKQPNSCMQITDDMYERFPGVEMWNPNTPVHEDCLYLNIWTPANAKTALKKYPVMVWIYGGGFYSGTATLKIYDASYLTTNQDVIVVSMQYRVGIFGFYYLGDEAPGNYGLLDQYVAIKWVKDNIAAFGGDTNSITIFGESAGAASVAFHLISPLTKPLFHRAIMQSSSATSPYALRSKEDQIDRATRIAKLVKCDRDTRAETVACMKTIPSDRLANVQWEVVASPFFFDLPVSPVVDGYFIEKTPEESMKAKEFKKCPVLAGTNKDEGIYFMMYGMQHIFPFDGSSTGDRKGYEEALKLALRSNSTLFNDAVDFEYVRSWLPNDSGSYRDIVDDIVGDFNFICPVHSLLDSYALDNQDAYMYRFFHRSSKNPWPTWMGVMHGYEIEFIFGLPLNTNLGYKEADINIANRMMKFWANFARTGDPNKSRPDEANASVEWPKYTTNGKEYVVLWNKKESPKTGQAARFEQCAFWNYYIPQLTASLELHEKCKNSGTSGSPPFLSATSSFSSFVFVIVFYIINNALFLRN
ncbi:cholinesterase-like [Tubulanus polymorphus]|uniref:cholinesterase-like n=1 Tax=Tubulanus polymorphus TaxID=672921 RepID=UPI003DA64FA5